MTTRPKRTGPGKSFRIGISLFELNQLFPDEQAAVDWFESIVWPYGRCCMRCGGLETTEVKSKKPMPYWCPDCKHYFSVRTGTAFEQSHLPLLKWAYAIFLFTTNLKGISSMKLSRDIDVTQKTAWFMLQRIRQGWEDNGYDEFKGPVEVDETYVGGKRKNMHARERKRQRALYGAGGSSGKTAVVGLKDRKTNQVRAQVVDYVDTEILDAFITEFTDADATVYSDGAKVYNNVSFKQKSVRHSIGEYVRGKVHTNGIESFWATLKRPYIGTFHYISPKHLHRYVTEFAGRHNVRNQDTIVQMTGLVAGLIGKRLTYKALIED